MIIISNTIFDIVILISNKLSIDAVSNFVVDWAHSEKLFDKPEIDIVIKLRYVYDFIYCEIILL